MGRINSKAKGSSFELKIARLLSQWSGYEFHRTPMSGALHWSNDTRVVSDIVPPQELVDLGWPFSIECKKVEYDWSFSGIVEGTSMFWKHWDQANSDASQEGLVTMLIFSRNYRGIYCAFRTRVFKSLGVSSGLSHLTVTTPQDSLVILQLADLMDHVSLTQVLNLKRL